MTDEQFALAGKCIKNYYKYFDTQFSRYMETEEIDMMRMHVTDFSDFMKEMDDYMCNHYDYKELKKRFYNYDTAARDVMFDMTDSLEELEK